jgi:hypothetical protein
MQDNSRHCSCSSVGTVLHLIGLLVLPVLCCLCYSLQTKGDYVFEGDDEYFDDADDDDERPRPPGAGRGRGGRGGMPPGGMGMGPGGPMAPGAGYGMRPGMMQMREWQAGLWILPTGVCVTSCCSTGDPSR